MSESRFGGMWTMDEVSKAVIAGCLNTIRRTIAADQGKAEALTGAESRREAKFADLWRDVEQGIIELEGELRDERKTLADR
jgi:hypothetical protein